VHPGYLNASGSVNVVHFLTEAARTKPVGWIRLFALRPHIEFIGLQAFPVATFVKAASEFPSIYC